MAIVLYQRLNALTESTIQKTNRALNLEVQNKTAIQWYNKPRHKPEPTVNWEVQNIQETSKPVKKGYIMGHYLFQGSTRILVFILELLKHKFLEIIFLFFLGFVVT